MTNLSIIGDLARSEANLVVSAKDQEIGNLLEKIGEMEKRLMETIDAAGQGIVEVNLGRDAGSEVLCS